MAIPAFICTKDKIQNYNRPMFYYYSKRCIFAHYHYYCIMKNTVFVITGILFGAFFIAGLINWLLSFDGFIPSAFSNREWFIFWTTYSTGIFALIIGYLAISFGNKNNEKALRQQTALLIRQENDRFKAEITEEVKQQNLMFNIMEHCATFVTIDHQDIPGMNARVIKDRARVQERCMNWNFVKQLYLQTPSLKESVDYYDACWNESVQKLDNYLKLQVDLLLKVQEVDRAVKSIGLHEKILLNLHQQLEHSIHKEDAKIELEIAQYEAEKEKAEKSRDEGNVAISNLVEKAKTLQDEILNAQSQFYTASILFLSEINKFTFMDAATYESIKSDLHCSSR